VLISAGCVFYGYLMKPLGLVIATAALVFVSAFGGHEFMVKVRIQGKRFGSVRADNYPAHLAFFWRKNAY
jgi:hypothetical protein